MKVSTAIKILSPFINEKGSIIKTDGIYWGYISSSGIRIVPINDLIGQDLKNYAPTDFRMVFDNVDYFNSALKCLVKEVKKSQSGLKRKRLEEELK